jgi:hypothetical protein
MRHLPAAGSHSQFKKFSSTPYLNMDQRDADFFALFKNETKTLMFG